MYEDVEVNYIDSYSYLCRAIINDDKDIRI